jgi:hypothetical protein
MHHSLGNLAHFSYFEKKIKVAYAISIPSVCLYVCVSPSIRFWMPESIYMKLGMYIMEGMQ